VKRALLVLAVAAAACQAGNSSSIERHGSGPGKHDPGPAPGGEYEGDPGEPDAGPSPDLGVAEIGAGGAGGEEEEADAGVPAADADGTVAIAMEKIAEAVARVACQRRRDCCMPAGPGLPDDPAGCQQALQELLEPSQRAIARAFGDDRVQYDGAALARCLDARASAGCDDVRTWEPLLIATSCPFVLPMVEAGQPCQQSFECRDSHCVGGSLDRDGRCVSPRLPDGEACDRGDDCRSGACHPTLDVCAAPTPGDLCR
jgi:hypothetical protein